MSTWKFKLLNIYTRGLVAHHPLRPQERLQMSLLVHAAQTTWSCFSTGSSPAIGVTFSPPINPAELERKLQR
ncbi:hypothetical protein CIB84_005848 [Bambusicola thoracicus]|uniref:Uncharacterized protein n=1 Tax=Bambusicola thoracicus TaxID=9083 RepID=A0A2P4T226_BAMTH|nr:hypothetical protein CIB84_005848 [Bambusicola thoracicus]